MVVSGQWLSGEDDDRTSEPRGVQTAIMVHAHDESGEAGERGSAARHGAAQSRGHSGKDFE